MRSTTSCWPPDGRGDRVRVPGPRRVGLLPLLVTAVVVALLGPPGSAGVRVRVFESRRTGPPAAALGGPGLEQAPSGGPRRGLLKKEKKDERKEQRKEDRKARREEKDDEADAEEAERAEAAEAEEQAAQQAAAEEQAAAGPWDGLGLDDAFDDGLPASQTAAAADDSS